MGQRYEKSKKNVSENKKTLERLHSDKDTLQNEYAPLSLLDSIQGLLDDETNDAIQGVKAVGELESQRIESETDTAEEEKREISGEIQSEISKLNAGLEKLRKSGNIEFGRKAVEQSSQEYKKQVEKFRALLGELGDAGAISSSAGAVAELGGIADSASEMQDAEKELFFFGDKSRTHETSLGSTSQEAIRLQQMGVNRVYLDSCHEANRQSVVNAVEKMFTEHPELRGQVSEINCHPMSNGTYASYGPTHFGSNFGGVLNINSDYFSDPNLDADLQEKSQMGWFIPNASSESVIEHELGHGMHLELCALSCGVKNGSIPDPETYNRVIQQYMDDVHADTIVENACRSLNIEFDSWEFSRQLSKYGGSNYGEAIAEAVSEVEHNEHPRPLASAIYRELLTYKQNLERRN